MFLTAFDVVSVKIESTQDDILKSERVFITIVQEDGNKMFISAYLGDSKRIAPQFLGDVLFEKVEDDA